MKKNYRILTSPLHLLFLGGIVLLFIVGMALWIIQKQNPEQNASLADMQTQLSVKDQYPKEYAFLAGYFDQIQRGNYEELKKSYWADGVETDILATCSNPLGFEDNRTPKQIWSDCSHLSGLDITIAEIKKANSVVVATVQFTDANGDISGSDIHPEWVEGHEVILYPKDDSFTVRQWNFLDL